MPNPNPDERLNENWTVEQLEAQFEGEDHAPHEQVQGKDHFFCDFCSTGVTYESEPRVAFYVADDVLDLGHPVYRSDTLVPLAVYCGDCATDRLLFPCEGYGEVRLFFDLDSEKVIQNVEVTDLSPADDGIPWDPKELSERVTQVPWDEHMLMQQLSGEDQLWGPENMITFLLSSVSGVDPRELINWDGTIDPKQLGHARKQYQKFMEKMRKGNYDRRKFRDHVRGDDQ